MVVPCTGFIHVYLSTVQHDIWDRVHEKEDFNFFFNNLEVNVLYTYVLRIGVSVMEL